MKVKSEAQLERLTEKDTTVSDVLDRLRQSIADHSEAIQEALKQQTRVLKELTVQSKTNGPIDVTVEMPKAKPRIWIAEIERDHRSLMSRVVITAK